MSDTNKFLPQGWAVFHGCNSTPEPGTKGAKNSPTVSQNQQARIVAICWFLSAIGMFAFNWGISLEHLDSNGPGVLPMIGGLIATWLACMWAYLHASKSALVGIASTVILAVLLAPWMFGLQVLLVVICDAFLMALISLFVITSGNTWGSYNEDSY